MPEDGSSAMQMPFHIYAGEKPSLSGFHSGYNTEVFAINVARNLNRHAEELGIKARYTVHPKPVN